MSEESAKIAIFWVRSSARAATMANLLLRELSAMTEVSNPYLSQIERGLAEPSAGVLTSIAQALNLSAEALFAQAGLMPESTEPDDNATETALRMDPDSPSRRSGPCLPCTAATSKRTMMAQQTM
jgi:transcriptional regulator with XRE-family HTH domain